MANLIDPCRDLNIPGNSSCQEIRLGTFWSGEDTNLIASIFLNHLQKEKAYWTLLGALGLYFICLLPPTIMVPLTVEDGPVEYSSALFFLLAAIFFLRHGIQQKNIILGILAFIFFFGAGEEISWGQRIFNLSLPDFFAEKNLQQEINIHNLSWFHRFTTEGEIKSGWILFFNMDRLFSLFWFSFTCLIPAAAISSSRFERFCARLHFPLAPLSLGLILLISYILCNILLKGMDPEFNYAAIEIKEVILALFFCLIAWNADQWIPTSTPLQTG